jgi:hypothetical protein
MALAEFYTHRQEQQYAEMMQGIKEKTEALAGIQKEHTEYRRVIEKGRQIIADAKAEAEV